MADYSFDFGALCAKSFADYQAAVEQNDSSLALKKVGELEACAIALDRDDLLAKVQEYKKIAANSAALASKNDHTTPSDVRFIDNLWFVWTELKGDYSKWPQEMQSSWWQIKFAAGVSDFETRVVNALNPLRQSRETYGAAYLARNLMENSGGELYVAAKYLEQSMESGFVSDSSAALAYDLILREPEDLFVPLYLASRSGKLVSGAITLGSELLGLSTEAILALRVAGALPAKATTFVTSGKGVQFAKDKPVDLAGTTLTRESLGAMVVFGILDGFTWFGGLMGRFVPPTVTGYPMAYWTQTGFSISGLMAVDVRSRLLQDTPVDNKGFIDLLFEATVVHYIATAMMGSAQVNGVGSEFVDLCRAVDRMLNWSFKNLVPMFANYGSSRNGDLRPNYTVRSEGVKEGSSRTAAAATSGPKLFEKFFENILVKTYARPEVAAAHDFVKAAKAAIAKNGKVVVCFSTGGTMKGFYDTLRTEYKDDPFWKNVIAFNQDEYAGISNTDPHSYRYEMNNNLYNHVGIEKANIHSINGAAKDLDAEAKNYERQIAKAGGFNIIVLGVGANGHIGFNEPGSPFEATVRPVDLTENTRQANARFFGGDLSAVPTQAVTIGPATTMSAQKVILIATGDAKKPPVNRALYQPANVETPVSVLKSHPDVTFYTDFVPVMSDAIVPASKEEAEQEANRLVSYVNKFSGVNKSSVLNRPADLSWLVEAADLFFNAGLIGRAREVLMDHANRLAETMTAKISLFSLSMRATGWTVDAAQTAIRMALDSIDRAVALGEASPEVNKVTETIVLATIDMFNRIGLASRPKMVDDDLAAFANRLNEIPAERLTPETKRKLDRLVEDIIQINLDRIVQKFLHRSGLIRIAQSLKKINTAESHGWPILEQLKELLDAMKKSLAYAEKTKIDLVRNEAGDSKVEWIDKQIDNINGMMKNISDRIAAQPQAAVDYGVNVRAAKKGKKAFSNSYSPEQRLEIAITKCVSEDRGVVELGKSLFSRYVADQINDKNYAGAAVAHNSLAASSSGREKADNYAQAAKYFDVAKMSAEAMSARMNAALTYEEVGRDTKDSSMLRLAVQVLNEIPADKLPRGTKKRIKELNDRADSIDSMRAEYTKLFAALMQSYRAKGYSEADMRFEITKGEKSSLIKNMSKENKARFDRLIELRKALAP